MPTIPARHRSTSRPLDHSSLLILLGYQVRRADVQLHQEFRERITNRFKLKPVEFSVLSLITANADVTGKELGEALAVAAPNLALIIASMIKRKLVHRHPNPNDGRSMFLTASPKGVELLTQVRSAVKEMEDAILADWKPRERDRLLRMLNRIHRINSK